MTTSEERLAEFVARMRAAQRKRLGAGDLWKAYAVAFPHRPSGPAEREGFAAALRTLAARGVLRLPPERSRCWDRSLRPPVPTQVVLVSPERPKQDVGWRAFPWHAKLAWVARLRSPNEEQIEFLTRVHRGLVEGWFSELAPLKYRSLQLTGNEKRLGKLLAGGLFADGRLTLEILGCCPDIAPLAWERVGSSDAMLVVENAGAFHVARRVLAGMQHAPWGLVACGAGEAFVSSIASLAAVPIVPTRIEYLGDLDAAGLEIAAAAAARAVMLGLPPLVAAGILWDEMFRSAEEMGHPEGWPAKGPRIPVERAAALSRFLPESVRTRACAVLSSGRRIPEEVLGPREVGRALSSA